MANLTPTAFIVHDSVRYVPDESGPLGTTETEITRLLEGICQEFPKDSRRILRERIITNKKLTPVCEGMIRIVAKRARVLDDEEYFEAMVEEETPNMRQVKKPVAAPFPKFTPPDPSQLRGDTTEFNSLGAAMGFLQSFAVTTPRKIAALLLDESNKPLAIHTNDNFDVRSDHAELRLVRALEANGMKSFPPSATVLVSLKPCAMCAAALLKFSHPTHPLKIFYAEDDPGPKAKNSALMQGSELWLKAGKPTLEMSLLKI